MAKSLFICRGASEWQYYLHGLGRVQELFGMGTGRSPSTVDSGWHREVGVNVTFNLEGIDPTMISQEANGRRGLF